LELENTAEHGAQHSVKVRKTWDPPDGYGSPAVFQLAVTMSRIFRATQIFSFVSWALTPASLGKWMQ
jgi:hypothetical protein